MSREWVTGDVAILEGRDGSTARAIWQGDQFATQNGHYLHHWQVTARPLVVIDPEDKSDDNDIARLCVLIGKHHGAHGAVDLGLDWYSLQAALHEFANPRNPKPEEPTGLGAVVEDDRGVRWVRVETAKGMQNPWQATLHVAESDDVRNLRWVEVQAVRVLSEGVQS